MLQHRKTTSAKTIILLIAINQEEFKKEKERLSDLYNSHKKSIDEFTKEIEARKARRVVLESFITNIENAHKIKEFDEGLFCALVEHVIVYKDRAEIRWKGMGYFLGG